MKLLLLIFILMMPLPSLIAQDALELEYTYRIEMNTPVDEISWCPNDRCLLVHPEEATSVYLYDAQSGREDGEIDVCITQAMECEVVFTEFDPAGKYLMVASRTLILIWDIEGKRQAASLPVELLYYAAWNSSGAELYIHDAPSVFLWNFVDNTTTPADLVITHAIYNLIVSPDRSKVMVINLQEPSTILDLNTGKIFMPVPQDDIMFAAWSDDSAELMTVAFSGNITIWSLESGLATFETPVLESHDNVIGTLYGGWLDDQRIYITYFDTLYLWNFVENRLEQEIGIDYGHYFRGFSSDAQFALFANNAGFCHTGDPFILDIWYLKTGSLQIQKSEDCPLIAAWAGEALVSSNAYNDIHIWDIHTGETLYILPHNLPRDKARFDEPGELDDFVWNSRYTTLVSYDAATIYIWHLPEQE